MPSHADRDSSVPSRNQTEVLLGNGPCPPLSALGCRWKSWTCSLQLLLSRGDLVPVPKAVTEPLSAILP